MKSSTTPVLQLGAIMQSPVDYGAVPDDVESRTSGARHERTRSDTSAPLRRHEPGEIIVATATPSVRGPSAAAPRLAALAGGVRGHRPNAGLSKTDEARRGAGRAGAGATLVRRAAAAEVEGRAGGERVLLGDEPADHRRDLFDLEEAAQQMAHDWWVFRE